jgi:lysophospholipase L1-like esterase
VGTAPYSDAECGRSGRAFPRLYAAARKERLFHHAACGGATTADVLNGQLGRIGRFTRLVTVTVGGNDVGFSARVAACLQGTDADCVTAVRASQQQSLTELPAKIDAVYAAIRDRAPGATVVVLGYAHFFELSAACAHAPLNLAKRTVMNEGVDTLNDVIAARASAAGAVFADVRPYFAGHGACASEPWMNGLLAEGGFHPNANGQRLGYLAALEASLL